MSESRITRSPYPAYSPRFFGGRVAAVPGEHDGRAFAAEIGLSVKRRGLMPIERRAAVGRG